MNMSRSNACNECDLRFICEYQVISESYLRMLGLETSISIFPPVIQPVYIMYASRGIIKIVDQADLQKYCSTDLHKNTYKLFSPDITILKMA